MEGDTLIAIPVESRIPQGSVLSPLLLPVPSKGYAYCFQFIWWVWAFDFATWWVTFPLEFSLELFFFLYKRHAFGDSVNRRTVCWWHYSLLDNISLIRCRTPSKGTTANWLNGNRNGSRISILINVAYPKPQEERSILVKFHITWP